MAALGRAFHAFLGRFPRLTDLQAEALPVVHGGRDAVVVGPAASGKTEAALTPLCERLASGPAGEGVGVLYVVPTRALANDTEVRVRDGCEALGLRLVIRTGDRPAALRPGDRADLLVTTPESLDSLLCRWPEGFRGAVAVVVDEAHLLDHTVRGDQMGVLVRRLLRWHLARGRPQMVALSATIADPAGLGRRLFGGEVVVVRAGHARPLEVLIAEDLPAALREVRARDLTKVLVFCNTRREVEAAAARVREAGPWPPERVAVHHGSLSRREREEVERAFRWWGAGVLACTMTLEVGVDIGDVDAVVLVGAPDGVEAFYQRVGRGCRRKAGLLALCVPKGDEDRAAFEGIIADARSGTLRPEPWDPDPAVAVQQVFSILFGRRQGVAREDVIGVLAPLGSRETLAAILDHLHAEGFVEPAPRDRLIATTKLMDLGERGAIHSNLADSGAVEVRDALTGRPLGEIDTPVAPGQGLTLGGRTWRVLRRRGRTLLVQPAGAEVLQGSPFGRPPSRSPFARFLPPEMR